MAATVLQSVIIYALDRKLQTMQKATLALVLVFGALTLGLHDERHQVEADHALLRGHGAGPATAPGAGRRTMLQLLLGSQLRLPARVWGRPTVAWIAYFVLTFMAASNAGVALFHSTEA